MSASSLSFYAYDPAWFRGGVHVAAADTTGDGFAEVITGAGPGGGPHVLVFDLSGGSPNYIASFLAYDPGFSGGVSVAGGDVNGDGIAEVITGPGEGGEPRVRVFNVDGGNVSERISFYAYDPAWFRGGVHVAAADTTGDGFAEVITGAGPGGGPHVLVFDLSGGSPNYIASFLAYDPGFSGGVSVAGGDVNGDGIAEVITGPGEGGEPLVRVFDVDGGNVSERISFYAYDPGWFRGGVHMAALDLNSIVPDVLPGLSSRLTLAILMPSEPHGEAGVQHGTVAAAVVRKALHADGRADGLILPRGEVGAAAEVGRVARRAPVALAGWLQSTVEQRLYEARRGRAPPCGSYCTAHLLQPEPIGDVDLAM